MPTSISPGFKLRADCRIAVRCFLYYFGDSFMGTGAVCEVSLKGWRIEGDHPVTVGMTLALRVFLPDDPKPVEVEQATVQWVKGRHFGLRVIDMKKAAHSRIGRYITKVFLQGHSAALFEQKH
ncbi:MAG: PilZ domain-containing protein [Nitrospiraceae bacterium]